jgi:hypothetical protein
VADSKAGLCSEYLRMRFTHNHEAHLEMWSLASCSWLVERSRGSASWSI